MARNLPEADIAASIFHSIAVQTVVTLSHGISFEAPILLCGGPLTFLPALRKAFCDYLHLSPNDFIVSGNSNLIPALGCAYRAKSADSAASVSALRSRMKKRNTNGMDQQSAASVQERERAPGMAQIKGEIRYRNPTAE